MQRQFDWSEHPFREIRDTGLTLYVGPCKGSSADQNIPSEKSEALDSPPMLGHAKVVWLIRTFLLSNQRHWTHRLCWSMQRWFDWSEHSFWEIRGTGLTSYVGPCKDGLTDQNIPSEKSEALDSPPMLGHAKVVWLIRTSLLRNQRHWTHCLCWSMQKIVWLIRTSLLKNQRHWTHYLCWYMQRQFNWSEHPFWEIRDTGLTFYVGPCKGGLTDQNIPSEKSEALDSPPMLVHAKVVWLIRTSLLRNQRHWTHLLWWSMQRVRTSLLIRGTGLTAYVGPCKGGLTDQNIPSEKSETLDSPTMLVHAKVIWLIRTSLLRNQRRTHHLCWFMQRQFDWSEHPF